jgi:hypothetical protein
MTTTNNELLEVPLRPLFRNSADEAPFPVDKLRRVTLPPSLPLYHKPTPYSGRIEKHHANSRKRRGRASPDLDQQFAGKPKSQCLNVVPNQLPDGMQDIRNEIRKAVDEVLTEVEGNANVELAQVVDDFQEKLQLALDYETRAFQSIAEERLLITTLSPEKKVVKKQEVNFGGRMRVFQRIVEEEGRALESLWQEWIKIQTETVCLAFEVLGPDKVAVEEEEMTVITPEKVDEAIHCYGRHQEALKGTLQEVVAIQNCVKKLTSQTLKTLKDQQQVRSYRLRRSYLRSLADVVSFNRSRLPQTKLRWTP